MKADMSVLLLLSQLLTIANREAGARTAWSQLFNAQNILSRLLEVSLLRPSWQLEGLVKLVCCEPKILLADPGIVNRHFRYRDVWMNE